MDTYYVNTNPHSNNEFDVHTSDCTFLASFLNREYLGDFANCASAVRKARKTFDTATACRHCCANDDSNETIDEIA